MKTMQMKHKISRSGQEMLQRAWLIVIFTMLFAGCDFGKERKEAAAIYKAHAEAVKKCEAKWRDQPRVPIRGSRYVLDATRLPWEPDRGLWSKDEECGAATMMGLFYWTGKEIISERQWLNSGRKLTDRPQDWLLLSVIAVLGRSPSDARARARHCEAHPEDCKSQSLGPALEWPPELVVRLKHYEDLEVRITKDYLDKLRPTDGRYYMDFVLRGWPKDDGRPRTMFCDVKRNVFSNVSITREEIENFDFSKQPKGGCQLEFWNFTFKGGSARVNTGTEALHQIVPALRALHQYINQSITEEKS